jgi:hypothetical protein
MKGEEKMAVEDLKFTEAEFVNEDISSLPDRVVGQAAFLKSKFDNIGKNKVALGKFNDLIDELGASGNGVNAEKLGGQLPSYYATQARVVETTNGAINTNLSVNASVSAWQRRNGWVRYVFMINGVSVNHGTVFGQIVGAAGLSAVTKFVGTCKLQSTGETCQCVFDVTEEGQIQARNDTGGTMTALAFDVTLPALNV